MLSSCAPIRRGECSVYLIRREAIVELDDTNLVTALTLAEAGILERLVGTGFGHSVAHYVHGAAPFKGGEPVCGEHISNNLDGLVLEAVGMHKGFRSNNAGCSAIPQNN